MTEEREGEDALRRAISGSRLGGLSPDEKPSAGAILQAMGGIRGLIESIVPGFTFLVLYTITRDVWISVLVPLGLSVIFVALRVFTKGQSALAFAGLIGVGISAGLALFTGRAEDNFIWGFITNAVFIVVILISLLARRPLVGFVTGLLTEKPYAWRTDAAKRRVSFVGTLLLLTVFAARLAVQVPLYFVGESGVQALAATKLVMGLPLYGAALWVVWLMVRSVMRTDDQENKVS
ncbi:MAG TPA: DUF3159 domain-containing protein [Candidatus Agrococcus pullicola]|uniref:DUF3159 domain-containing protein n=1 Tax=Candidatus Agrococcus pullicola TaxID=2838429 RepID=A0A9D1YTU2_9MICO|nr:DUF3159 domain-containing protein [Candidatus Agrococcus pullicola]